MVDAPHAAAAAPQTHPGTVPPHTAAVAVPPHTGAVAGPHAHTGAVPTTHVAGECPECIVELSRDSEWWRARPPHARLVGLVVAREGMPSVVAQRDALTRFGVPIEGFRHPAPEPLEGWSDRILRFFDTLQRGDVLVVAGVQALGNDRADEARTVAALRGRGVMVKVLGHGGHLSDTGR